MRQVGHVASKMHAQPGSTNKTTPNSANTPRWQGVKNTVSQGLHKFASIFSRPKGAPRSVPSGPQFRQIQMGEAKQRIQQCTDELRGLWTPDLGTKPPRPGLSFQGADATGLGTFLRQTTPGTDGKAAAMVMTPFLAATGHQLCQKTEALLIQHGQDGKPVNLELDPSKDEAVKDKAELDRRVKIIDQINTALLDELLGPVSSDSHQQQLQALPLHVQAAITAVTDTALERCAWDTHAPDSSKTADQLQAEHKIRRQVVAHAMLTGVMPVLFKKSGAIGTSDPVMSRGLMQVAKLLQTEFNGKQGTSFEANGDKLKPIVDGSAARINHFAEVVSRTGGKWGGQADNEGVYVGSVDD